jgi:pimeloyl-ACP methyl ester carboxylesterase
MNWLLSLTLAFAMVDGAKINFAVTGKGDKTVVFVHGWTCDSTTWDRQVPSLARKNQVITIDLPGHGKSGMPKGDFSMDLFAKAIEGVRREVKAEKMILVGHSMGTPVIRQYARLFPQHVQALVLVDGPVIDEKSLGNFAGLAEQMKKDTPNMRKQFVNGMFTPATTPELRVKIEKMMMTPPDATAVGAMAAMWDPAIWKDDVINVPVLGLYAEKSRVANRELLAKAFPAIEYNEIPGTDHFLMLEKPAEFNKLLNEFVDKLQ